MEIPSNSRSYHHGGLVPIKELTGESDDIQKVTKSFFLHSVSGVE